jgi:xanthine dehydrogenase YagR molybdenum-binding subunit
VSEKPSKPSKEQADAPSHYVGQPMDRVDGRLKVTGGARYAADFEVPGIAHAVLIQSAIARGRVTDIDTQEAERAPGVLAVITFENMPQMPLPSVPPAGTSVPLLSRDISYSGQNIAVVIAETLEQAQGAAQLLDVQYDAEAPDAELERGLDRGFGAQQRDAPRPLATR